MDHSVITRNPEDLFIKMEMALEIEWLILELEDSLDSKILDLLVCGYSKRVVCKTLRISYSTLCYRLALIAPFLASRLLGDPDYESSNPRPRLVPAGIGRQPSDQLTFDVAGFI